jgi:hypothetical protein
MSISDDIVTRGVDRTPLKKGMGLRGDISGLGKKTRKVASSVARKAKSAASAASRGAVYAADEAEGTMSKIVSSVGSALGLLGNDASSGASEAASSASKAASSASKAASSASKAASSASKAASSASKSSASSIGKKIASAASSGEKDAEDIAADIGSLGKGSSSSSGKSSKSVAERLDEAVDGPGSALKTDSDSDESGSDDSDSKGSGWSSWLTFNYKTGFILIVILLFLGFNVLKFAGLGLEFGKNVISALFGPLLSNTAELIGMSAGDTLKRTANMSATGTKEVADLADEAVHDAVDGLDDLTGLAAAREKKSKPDPRTKAHIEPEADTEPEAPGVGPSPPKKKTAKQTALEKAFEEAKSSNAKGKKQGSKVKNDDSGSVMQKSKGGNKSGWCFVGEDQGFRSCMSVTESEKCMSGEIFSSKDICEHPSLRA